jgi:hypothetical protein
VTPVTHLLPRWARCMVGYLGAKAAPSMPADDNDSSVPRVLKALRAFGSAMSAGADAFRLAESKPRVRRSLWLLAPKALAPSAHPFPPTALCDQHLRVCNSSRQGQGPMHNRGAATADRIPCCRPLGERRRPLPILAH